MNYDELAQSCNIVGDVEQFVKLIKLEVYKQCAAEGDILSELYNKPEYKSFSAKGAIYNYVNIIRNLAYAKELV